jgi:alpha/beta superfamily hydrolase
VGKKAGEERLRQNPVFFPCGELTLQGLCYLPDSDGVFPAVVLCHPHPLYGGSMDNNVILAVSSALVERSTIAFAFNFRGVGDSQGKYGDGIAELEDARAAISWLVSHPEVDGKRLGLLGYSFGAAVALPVACYDEKVKAVALISLPPGRSHLSQLKGCTKPKLMVCGTNDFVVSLDQARLMNQEAAEPKQFELISGADHFWLGYGAEVGGKVAAFFSASL